MLNPTEDDARSPKPQAPQDAPPKRAIAPKAPAPKAPAPKAPALKMVDAALDYARQGVPVFPLRPRGKEPITEHGFQDATTDEKQIRAWWKATPQANIGAPTGAASGFDVLDFDPRNGGDADGVIPDRPALPSSRTARSGSGGLHVFFQHHDGMTCKNGLYAGVDLKADGGYIVLPPSIHPSGARYEWIHLADAAPLPAWVVDDRAAQSPQESPDWQANYTPPARPARQEDAQKWITGALAKASSEGSRNRAGFWLAMQLLDNGIPDPEAAILEYAALAPEKPGDPYTAREAWRSLASAARYPRREPARSQKPVNFADRKGGKRRQGQDMASGADSAGDNGPTGPTDGNAAPDDDPTGLELIVTNDGKPLREISAASLAALYRVNDPPRFFARASNLARIRWDASDTPTIETLALDQLRYVLERTAQFAAWKTDRKSGEKYLVPIAPPQDVVRDILAAPSWKLPPLAAVTRIPVMRPDGSILSQPGYDQGSQLYYSPDHLTLPVIPEHPTAQDAQDARALLDDALDEFPYDSEASKANMYGLLLTLVVRPTIRGCVPLALLDAPRPGSGKSLLTTVLGIIATGAPVAFENMPDDDAELRKKITTALQDGDTLICYDNVDQPIKSGVLANALTALVWKDRLLGTNQNISVPQRATWIATGNNLIASKDIPRRCYRVRLDSGEEHPEQRSGFRHADLTGYVMDHRGELLAALLTIARAWYDAGRPRGKVSPIFGSFQEWADILSGILAYAGVDGFLANRQAELDAEDDEGHEWTAFLGAWDATLGDMPITAARLVKEVISEGSAMREALPSRFLIALHRNDGELTHYLGNALRRQINIPRGPEKLRIARCGVGHGGAMTWAVKRPKTGDTGEGRAHVSPPVSPVVSPESMGLDAPRGDTGDTGDTDTTHARVGGGTCARASAPNTQNTPAYVSPVSPVSPRTALSQMPSGLAGGDTGGDTGEGRAHVSPPQAALICPRCGGSDIREYSGDLRCYVCDVRPIQASENAATGADEALQGSHYVIEADATARPRDMGKEGAE